MKRSGRDCAGTATQALLNGRPERLVGLGFRHWMLGCQTGDIDCWAEAWNIYRAALGCREANLAVSHLSSWVQAVNVSACRDICVGDCGRTEDFCRDERLAMTMVAACQYNTCPALRACAFALVESTRLEEVVHETETFSTVLRGLGQMLAPQLLSTALVEQSSCFRSLH